MSDRSLEDVKPEQIEPKYDKTFVSFESMDVESKLLYDVYEYGFECPTAIQQRSIVPAMRGKNVIIRAPSATGKTTSICISAMHLVDSSIATCQAIILTTSFDVAQQIQRFAAAIGRSKQIKCTAVAGRVPINDSISALRNAQQFVVGTPGQSCQQTN